MQIRAVAWPKVLLFVESGRYPRRTNHPGPPPQPVLWARGEWVSLERLSPVIARKR